ncbi:hypothetical protein GQ44DRAFT_135973 [Phaeosphaeriaceae sp. PMI808]|nr:hypothetical protein GQ44DRAFT_135973 [Phaeosphaeriaceae sp. PMI808]
MRTVVPTYPPHPLNICGKPPINTCQNLKSTITSNHYKPASQQTTSVTNMQAHAQRHFPITRISSPTRSAVSPTPISNSSVLEKGPLGFCHATRLPTQHNARRNWEMGKPRNHKDVPSKKHITCNFFAWGPEIIVRDASIFAAPKCTYTVGAGEIGTGLGKCRRTRRYHGHVTHTVVQVCVA